jgi:methylthioribose-1-phosphate isomerase
VGRRDRPLLQGARLTAWELQRLDIPATLIPDVGAAALFGDGLVDLVVVGADRIAANGDTANKIGTYGLAVLAHHHGVPFYVAAPVSTVDPHTASGADIVIERRDGEEVAAFGGAVAPADADREPCLRRHAGALVCVDHGAGRAPRSRLVAGVVISTASRRLVRRRRTVGADRLALVTPGEGAAGTRRSDASGPGPPA